MGGCRTVDGHVVTEDTDAGGNAELLTSEMPGNAGAVPAFMEVCERRAAADAEAQALGEPTPGLAVGGGHPLDQPRRVGTKAATRPRASDRTRLFAETRQRTTQDIRAVRRVEAGERVAEVLIIADGQRLLIGVRRATDRAQEAEVVDVRERLAVDPQALSELHGQQAVAEGLLDWKRVR